MDVNPKSRCLLCLVIACWMILAFPFGIHGIVKNQTERKCILETSKCHKVCDRAARDMASRRQYSSTYARLKEDYGRQCVNTCDFNAMLCSLPAHLSNVGLLMVVLFAVFSCTAYPMYYLIRLRNPLPFVGRSSGCLAAVVNCPFCFIQFMSTKINANHPTGVTESLYCPSCLCFIAGIA